MEVKTIFNTMEYGPAPESREPVDQWLEKHGNRFELFVDGAWRPPKNGKYFDTTNPGNTDFLAPLVHCTVYKVSRIALILRLVCQWGRLGTNTFEVL